MTDEEAAQMRNNGDPWGMTDEEAAQMRQMQRKAKRAKRARSRTTSGAVG